MNVAAWWRKILHQMSYFVHRISINDSLERYLVKSSTIELIILEIVNFDVDAESFSVKWNNSLRIHTNENDVIFDVMDSPEIV